MASLDKKWCLRFDGCRLAISAFRLREHTELGQINPFLPITPASALQPLAFVDIVDASDPVQPLTGHTLADLFAGKHDGVPMADVRVLMRHMERASARRWLAGVGEQLRQFGRQRAVRNKPDLFLSVDSSNPLHVAGLRCALPDWLKAHGSEKASRAQWSGRIANLASKGLRAEEIEFSGLLKRFLHREGPAVTGVTLSDYLNYDALRLSILPVIRPAGSQLEFVKVPANAAVKRIKPKLKTKLVTRPQWQDRVLGYWIDSVEWADLLGRQQSWMAFTYRGQPIVSRLRPSGLCPTLSEAKGLASSHAEQVFPKLTAKGRWSSLRLTGGEGYREWLVTLPHYPESFFSNHFDHRNVLLHVRCDMREGPDGHRVLLLQEVQSDWAQRARRCLKFDSDGPDPMAVPPWLQEWPALALKLMLLHAAHQGATALAWTRGKVQVERYRGLGEAGLLELYDRTLPAEATHLLRPYGRKCETIEVFEPVNFFIEPADIGYAVFDDEKEPIGVAPSWEDAQALLPDGAHEVLKPMHGVLLDAVLRDRLLTNGFYAWGGGIRS